MRRAAAALGFDVFLAQVTIEKTGPGNDCGCAEEVAERNADREDRRDNMGCGYDR